MKTLYNLFILLFISSVLFAETPDLKGWLKGKVTDATSSQPVEYATIAVYNSIDSSLVNGAISHIDGTFKIQELSPGNYFITISFIGYEQKTVDQILVKNQGEKVDLGPIFINRASQDLEEVKIVANRSLVKYEIDKKVIDVSRQQTNASGTAVDILEKIPSVRVDVEGNVSLRGSGGFTVLIDGKPSILEPSEALQQLPATTIDNIEIITNPSAKYDPDGIAGIINIVTKKQRLQGVSALVNANYGLNEKYGADILVNVKNDKLSYYVGADYNHRNFPGRTKTVRENYLDGTTNNINSKGDIGRAYTRKSYRMGLEYALTPKSSISVGGRLGTWEMNSYSYLNYFESTTPGSTSFNYISEEDGYRGGLFLSGNLDFKQSFNDKGHQVIASLQYRDRDTDEENINILTTLAEEQLEGRKTTEVGPARRLRIKVDYTLPFSQSNKFEAGYQSRMGFSEDNTELYDLVPASGDFLLLPQFSNAFDYHRNIHSLYSLYAGMVGNFGYQLGLRGEYTFRDIHSQSTDEHYKIDRFDYFPTFHFSYTLTEDIQLMTSYSRRIERSRGWYLEPFLTWTDAYNVRKGNPDLLPEYIDSYEIGYMQSFGDNSLSLESYYRITNNKVERVRSVYDEDVMLHTFENIGKDYALGGEVMFSYIVSKFWTIDLTGDLYQYRVEGVLYDEKFDNSSFNWSSNIDNTFNLKKGFKIQVNNRYRSPTVTSQGRTEGFYSMNMAVKKDFLNRILSANLQVRDVFGTSKHEYTSEGPDFYYYNYHDHKAPIVTLTVTYRFHNYKPSRGGDFGGMNGGDGDDF